MKRIYMTMDEKLIERFDKACQKAGLTRAQYLTSLLSGRIDIRPPVFQYREMIRQLSSIERDLKVLALKDTLSDNDRVLIMTRLSDLKEVFTGKAFREDGNGTER